MTSPRSSVSTPPHVPPAGRRSSLSAEPYATASGRIVRSSPPVSSVATIAGSLYISEDFQNEIAFLGLRSSSSFVRTPEGNGCVRRAIRTLKGQLLWERTFEAIEELRLALIESAELYSEHWLMERHGFRSPAQRCCDHYAASQWLFA